MPRISIVFSLAACLSWHGAGPASAQVSAGVQAVLPPSAGALSSPTAMQAPPTVDDLRLTLEKQSSLLEAQAKELQRQSELISQQQKAIEAHTQALQVLQTQVDRLGSGSTIMAARTVEEVKTRETLAAAQEATPETPSEILHAGEFPGSIHLPGTNLNAKYGGFVRVGGVNSFEPIGSDDRFVVGSIPAAGQATASDEPRSTISAKRSRMNMDVRMDSSVGQFRAFVEGDFAGDGGTENYRLRHAFGQYKGLLLGKTWSTFMDLASIPEEVDFEGISAQINVRQPLMRIGSLKFAGRSWAAALEDPQPSLSGGDGVGKLMDMTGRTTWATERGQIQLALLLRTLAGKPTDQDGNVIDNEDTATGYGLSLSGWRQLDRYARDNIKWQLNAGRGIGRYINDLGSVGGQDGVFNPETGNLEVLPVVSSYVAYQRWWRPKKHDTLISTLRSTFVYSWVYVDNYDFQDGGAYHQTQRASFNLIVSPISALDLGAEIIWGERTNKDDSVGSAWQFQTVATFRF